MHRPKVWPNDRFATQPLSLNSLKWEILDLLLPDAIMIISCDANIGVANVSNKPRSYLLFNLCRGFTITVNV